MTITLKVYPYNGRTSQERAESLFANTGATKFDGAYVRKVCDRYEFNIPQAFTEGHPAIRYLIEHA